MRAALSIVLVLATAGCELVVGNESRTVVDAGADGAGVAADARLDDDSPDDVSAADASTNDTSADDASPEASDPADARADHVGPDDAQAQDECSASACDDQATQCSQACVDTDNACLAGCPGSPNPQCPKGCANGEMQCKQSCNATCNGCVAAAACKQTNGCGPATK